MNPSLSPHGSLGASHVIRGARADIRRILISIATLRRAASITTSVCAFHFLPLEGRVHTGCVTLVTDRFTLDVSGIFFWCWRATAPKQGGHEGRDLKPSPHTHLPVHTPTHIPVHTHTHPHTQRNPPPHTHTHTHTHKSKVKYGSPPPKV